MTPSEREENSERWFSIVKDYIASGLDSASYATKHDLNKQNLLCWAGRYHERSRGFVPAYVNGGAMTKVAPAEVCKIKLAAGHSVILTDASAVTSELTNLITRLAEVSRASAV